MTSLAQHDPLPWIAGATVLGLLVGSFLNVLVLRLPRMMQADWQQQAREILGLPSQPGPAFNLALPRSHCPRCQHVLRLWENIPLLSYALLRGRCSACQARISPRYPLVELSTALLSGYVAWHAGFTLQAIVLLLLTWGLLAMSLIDLEHQLLPDSLVLPLLWLGLLLNTSAWFTDLWSAVWGAALGYMLLWTLYWLFRLCTGREGMGHGDFKLLALLGAWGGWQILPSTILLSSLSGLLVGMLYLLLSRRSRHTPIPFGPHLALAGWLSLLWQQQLPVLPWLFPGLAP